MNGKASELYSWGPPKLKSELRLLQKKTFDYLKPYASTILLCPAIILRDIFKLSSSI